MAVSSAAYCDLCGGRHHELMFVLTDRLFGLGGRFPLVKCQDCGLIFINPRPGLEELEPFYPREDYDLYQKAAGLEDKSLGQLEKLLGPRRAAIDKYRRPGRLLDIGFGDGSFLYYMKQSGWQVAGVDFNAAIAELVQKQYGIETFAGELQAAGYADGAFDVVTMWGVIEHTQSPRETVAEIGRISADGALLAIYTQNAAAPEARLLKRDWFIYEAPRHLYSFDAGTLAKLLAAGGFEIQKIVYETPLYYCQMNWQYFKESRLKGKNDVVHNPTPVDRGVVKLLSLYRRLLSGRKWSPAMTVYAVKRGVGAERRGEEVKHAKA